jgi:hypothetical protein
MKRDRKNYFHIAIFFSLAVFLCLSTATLGQAIEPSISDIIITSNDQNVLLYARLVNGFKTDMEAAILAGVPTFFTLQINVHQPRSYVWDKKIISQEIKRTIKYDNLKKTFSIFTNGNTVPNIFPDFESAQKAMADFNGIIVVPLNSLVKGNNYYVEMKIKIDKVRLPLRMEYILFFVSYWDFETTWYRRNFSY